MKPIGYIYLTTCLVNSKIYIGKHEISKDKNYIGSGTLLKRAVKKYGKKNFKRKILRLCYSLHELRVWEHVYIVKYKSYIRSIGYNIAKGDVNTSEYNPAKLPEVREKIRKSRIGRFSGENHWNFGRQRPEETKTKIRNSHIGLKHSEEARKKMSQNSAKYWLNKKMPEEARKKMSLAKKGKYLGSNNPNFGNKKLSGKNNPMYGTRFKWINNGKNNKRLSLNSEIPIGWNDGYIQKQKQSYKSISKSKIHG